MAKKKRAAKPTRAQELADALDIVRGKKPAPAKPAPKPEAKAPAPKALPSKTENKRVTFKVPEIKGKASAEERADYELKRYKSEGKLQPSFLGSIRKLFVGEKAYDEWKYKKVKSGEIEADAAERDRLKKAVTVTGGIKETTLKGGEKHFEFPTLTKEGAALVKEGALEAIKLLKAGKSDKEAMKPLEDLLKKGPTKELTRDALLEAVKKVEKDANVTAPIKERLEKGFKKEETRPELEKVRKVVTEAPKKPIAEFAKAGPKADITSPLLKQVLEQQGKAPRIAQPLEKVAAKGPTGTIAGPVAQAYAQNLAQGANRLGFKPAAKVARREFERLQPQIGAQYLGQGTRFSSAFQGAQQEARLNLAERLAQLKSGLKTQERQAQRGALPGLIGAAETQLGGETQRAQALSGARATEAGLGQQQLNTLLGRLGINEAQQLQLAQALGSEELAGKTLNLDQFKTLLNQMNISEAQQSQLLGMLTNAGLNTAQLDVTKLGQFLGAQQTEAQRQTQAAGEFGRQGLLQGAQQQTGLQTLAGLGTTPTTQAAIQGPQPTTFQTLIGGVGQAIPQVAAAGVKYALGV